MSISVNIVVAMNRHKGNSFNASYVTIQYCWHSRVIDRREIVTVLEVCYVNS